MVMRQTPNTAYSKRIPEVIVSWLSQNDPCGQQKFDWGLTCLANCIFDVEVLYMFTVHPIRMFVATSIYWPLEYIISIIYIYIFLDFLVLNVSHDFKRTTHQHFFDRLYLSRRLERIPLEQLLASPQIVHRPARCSFIVGYGFKLEKKGNYGTTMNHGLWSI